MRVVRVTAKTLDEALARAQATVGANLQILHTRQFRQGGIMGFGATPMIEITVGVEDAAPARPAPAAAENRSASASVSARLLERALEVQRSSPPPAQPAAPARDELAEATARILARQAAFGRGMRPSAAGDAGSPSSSSLAAASAAPSDARILMAEVKDIRDMVTELKAQARLGDLSAFPRIIQQLYATLVEAEVAPELARGLMRRVAQAPGSDSSAGARESLERLMTRLVKTCGQPPAGGRNGRPRLVALIGPTGAGKTTTLAKLAARFRYGESLRAAFLTTDTYRLASVAQLQSYADIMNVPMAVALTPSDAVKAVDRLSGCDVVFIDTAGRSHANTAGLEELAHFLAILRPDETHLVLSATSHGRHLMAAVKQFGAMKADRLILTKLDEMDRYGAALNVLVKAGLPLSYITTGQEVPANIEVARSQRFVRLVLGAEPLAHAQAARASSRPAA
jgi:flagellar biosynthesis protein FlhF